METWTREQWEMALKEFPEAAYIIYIHRCVEHVR